MNISAHFSNIQNKISEEIGQAKYNIFVAVAWITDKSLWTILEQKAEEGVLVQVVLVPDEINKKNKANYNKFVEDGGQLYWDEHHHKFCVIDVKTVITGSYNWTYMANNREKRENIIVLKENSEVAEQFSDEFKLLLKKSQRFKLPLKEKIIYIEREIEKKIIVEKPIVKVLEKQINTDINRFSIYERGGKSRCGKCHSSKIISNPKAPKNIKRTAKYYCKDCNTYFSEDRVSI